MSEAGDGLRAGELVLVGGTWGGLLFENSRVGYPLPGLETTLRSKPTSTALRVGVAIDGEPIGSVLFSFTPKGEGRAMIKRLARRPARWGRGGAVEAVLGRLAGRHRRGWGLVTGRARWGTQSCRIAR